MYKNYTIYFLIIVIYFLEFLSSVYFSITYQNYYYSQKNFIYKNHYRFHLNLNQVKYLKCPLPFSNSQE